MIAPDAGVAVVNFGCRVNLAESETILQRATEAGHTDLIVINTCAVTAEAVRQARQAIRRQRKHRPDSPIIVTGCAAQVDPARFAAMPEVTRIVGNERKCDRATWRLHGDKSQRVGAIQSDASSSEPHPAPTGHTRAFVPVQNGCDHCCTFCIIPAGRGRSRSVPSQQVVAQVQHSVAAGHLEVVLTGVDMTAYGRDLASGGMLGQLVKAILEGVPELRRLRLSSLDSVEVDEALLGLFADEPRLMPHVHLSLQAGSDLILKRMKRRHRRHDAIRLCARLRQLRPEIALGADIIVGFPTESEADFAASLALIDECGLTHCHVFPFSARPGTPAARMPQLDAQVVRERAHRLRSRAEAALAAHLRAQLGKTLSILTECGGRARSEDFTKVRYAGAAPGTICDVLITGAGAGELLTGAPT
jgi:threonylcarbamoyladenosine tRNA methylthiotransferase MtaB